MSEELATCLICRKKYHVCLSCKEKMKLSPWKIVTDTEDCWKIFYTIKQYKDKIISKEQAKNNLSQVKFIKDDIDKSLWKVIDEIMSVDKTATADKSKVNKKAVIEENKK